MSGSAKARTTRARVHTRRRHAARRKNTIDLSLRECFALAGYVTLMTLLMGIGVSFAMTIARLVARAAFTFAGVM